jgi:DNA-binding GntR family transcriptional regulator
MNAQESVFAHVKAQILGGKLRAGEGINTTTVARELGVSRIPVREAMLQLEAAGLVVFGANGRPLVRSLTANEIFELFEIRIALEVLAIERAVPRLTAEDFRELESDLERMKRATGAPKKWLALHDTFHNRIYAAAQMPRLLEEIRRFRQSIYPYLLLYIDLHGAPEIPGQEHPSLLKVVKTGNAADSARALAEHIRKGAAGLVYGQMGGREKIWK